MGKCVKISQKLHGGDRRHIWLRKQKNLKIDRWVIFHSSANFHCQFLKIGQCDLFPVLLEYITLFTCSIIEILYPFLNKSKTLGHGLFMINLLFYTTHYYDLVGCTKDKSYPFLNKSETPWHWLFCSIHFFFFYNKLLESFYWQCERYHNYSWIGMWPPWPVGVMLD